VSDVKPARGASAMLRALFTLREAMPDSFQAPSRPAPSLTSWPWPGRLRLKRNRALPHWIYSRQRMDHNQILVLALANVPTIITVLIGILLNNGRLTDLNSRMTSMENRFTNLENRLTNLDHKFDTRFDLLLGKVVDLDNRLTRIEVRLH
jgi:hypothetical protein